MASNVTKQQVEQARQVNLYEYLIYREPELVFRTSANEIRLKAHDSLNITPSGKWHWHSRGIGGTSNPINFFEKVLQRDFVTSVQQLSSFYALNTPTKKLLPKPGKRTAKRLTLPKCCAAPTRALEYLTEQRGLDPELLRQCVEEKRLMETAKYHNCLFLGYDTAGAVRFGCIRGTGDTYHGDLSGSDKRYGFYLPARTEQADTVAVSEAPIDALSVATLDKIKQGAEYVQGRYYLALSGVAPLALVQFLTDHPQVRTVLFYMDADRAGVSGIASMRRVIEEHELLKYQVVQMANCPPRKPGTDYNDVLLEWRAYESARARFEALMSSDARA